MDALPWDAIAKVVLGALVLVGGYFGIQKSGKLKAEKRAAEKGVSDAKKVDKITGAALPVDDDAVRELLRDR